MPPNLPLRCAAPLPDAVWPVLLGLLWALGVTVLLRNLYDLARPLPLRDSKEQGRLWLSVGVFTGLALFAVPLLDALMPASLDTQASVTPLVRLSAAGAGMLLVLRCGLRLLAKWARPAPLADPDEIPLCFYPTGMMDHHAERRLEGRAFRASGGGDLIGAGAAIGLLVLAARGLEGMHFCLGIAGPAQAVRQSIY